MGVKSRLHHFRSQSRQAKTSKSGIGTILGTTLAAIRIVSKKLGSMRSGMGANRMGGIAITQKLILLAVQIACRS